MPAEWIKTASLSVLSALAVAVPLVSGCKDVIKRERTFVSADAIQLINRNYVFLDRQAGGRAALLNFRTHQDALCAYKAWPSEDPDAEPEEVSYCATEQATSNFSELIEPLDPERDYSIRIYAWVPELSIESADRYLIREEALPIDKRDLYVARFDNPLQIAEVHRHRLNQDFDPEALAKRLALETGCHNEIPRQPKFYATAADVIRLSSVTTRGFGLGESKRHDHYSNRFILSFSILQEGDDWEWLFGIDGQGFRFVSRQPSILQNLELTDHDSLNQKLTNTQLTVATTTLSLESGSDLTLRWSASPLLPNSYLIAQIGHSGGKGVYCVFDAAKNQAVIPWANLAGLPKTAHDIQLNLYSQQLFQRATEGTVPWLIISHDWRTSRIQVQ